MARFNERFLLSLVNCNDCLVVDDELNVLPISAKAKAIFPLPPKDPVGFSFFSTFTLFGCILISFFLPRKKKNEPLTGAEAELKDLKKSLEDTQPVGSLVKNAKTLDQV